ncbi:acylneuraminate cytidylyltransferase [Thalassospira sp. MCCC 1A02898]|jgi:N-acylneuraminate cytidylyltransferase|nr:acylneuraminate cytidylyltransferase [Thalassospira sp. MCCC 1A02898]
MIFARGGSKGVPRKNVRLVKGKPLIAHSIECALSASCIGQVVVSTDDEEIAEVSEKFGARVLMRPASLAADATPEILAWRHAIEQMPEIFSQDKQDVLVSLPATSPLRAPSDIDAAVKRHSEGDCDVVFAISPSLRSPYLNMVTINEDRLINVVISEGSSYRRQDVPCVYDITTSVYVANTDYVMSCDRLVDGKVGAIVVPQERALDIDTEYDLYLADIILRTPYRGPQFHDK